VVRTADRRRSPHASRRPLPRATRYPARRARPLATSKNLSSPPSSPSADPPIPGKPREQRATAPAPPRRPPPPPRRRRPRCPRTPRPPAPSSGPGRVGDPVGRRASPRPSWPPCGPAAPSFSRPTPPRATPPPSRPRSGNTSRPFRRCTRSRSTPTDWTSWRVARVGVGGAGGGARGPGGGDSGGGGAPGRGAAAATRRRRLGCFPLSSLAESQAAAGLGAAEPAERLLSGERRARGREEERGSGEGTGRRPRKVGRAKGAARRARARRALDRRHVGAIMTLVFDFPRGRIDGARAGPQETATSPWPAAAEMRRGARPSVAPSLRAFFDPRCWTYT